MFKPKDVLSHAGSQARRLNDRLSGMYRPNGFAVVGLRWRCTLFFVDFISDKRLNGYK